MRCLKCGYDLVHLKHHRCPGCGRAFDPDDPHTTEPLLPSRGPTVWDAILIRAAAFGGLLALTMLLPSVRDNLAAGFDSPADGRKYALNLISVISLAFTVVVLLWWHVRWRLRQRKDED